MATGDSKIGQAEVFRSTSAAGTLEVGKRLAERLKVGDCVALVGELGAGKTALVRGLALGLGLTDERMVSSPTFVLVQEYPAAITVYHIDLYRMSDPANELVHLGLSEMLRGGVVLIEWADRAGDQLPRPRWQIEIFHASRRSRRFVVSRIQ